MGDEVRNQSFHGSAYWFNQDAIFDHVTITTTGPSRTMYKTSVGGSVGGPIIKNKIFFFADVEVVRANNPVNIVATVPTAAEIDGDFSQAMTYDQKTGKCGAQSDIDPFLIDPSSSIRPAYTNNAILTSEIDRGGSGNHETLSTAQPAGDPFVADVTATVVLSTSQTFKSTSKQIFNSIQNLHFPLVTAAYLVVDPLRQSWATGSLMTNKIYRTDLQ